MAGEDFLRLTLNCACIQKHGFILFLPYTLTPGYTAQATKPGHLQTAHVDKILKVRKGSTRITSGSNKLSCSIPPEAHQDMQFFGNHVTSFHALNLYLDDSTSVSKPVNYQTWIKQCLTCWTGFFLRKFIWQPIWSFSIHERSYLAPNLASPCKPALILGKSGF